MAVRSRLFGAITGLEIELKLVGDGIFTLKDGGKGTFTGFPFRMVAAMTVLDKPVPGTPEIQFLADGVLLGTVEAVDGTAQLDVSGLTAGSYRLKAVYAARVFLNVESNEAALKVVDMPTWEKLNAAPISGTAPLTVEVTGHVTGGFDPEDEPKGIVDVSLKWFIVFGDASEAVTGLTRDLRISHTYDQPSTYHLKVLLSDIRQFTITVVPPLQVTLDAAPMSGVAPLIVTFVPGVGGGTAPYKWEMTFGDQSPSEAGQGSPPRLQHTYTTPGTLTAILKITDAIGLAKRAFVNISVGTTTAPPPPAPTVPVVISSPFTTDGAGRPKTTFTPGETVVFGADYKNSSSSAVNVLAAGQPLAPDGTIIPTSFSQISLNPGQVQRFFWNMVIPNTGPRGTWTVEFNAFSDFPSKGGIPLADTVTVNFTVS